MPSMRKCVIIQFEPRHEEVIPSVIAACNAAGYRPQVFLNRRIRRVRGDIFDEIRTGDADITYTALSPEPGGKGFDLGTVLTDDVDFVVLNTFNRRKAAKWAKTCGKPVISIVHNVDQFMGDAVFHDALERDDFAFLTLAPHVTSEVLSRMNGRHVDKFGLLTSFVESDPPNTYQVSEPRKVVVPGNMSLRTRNYRGLIDALAENPTRWDNLRFEFPSSGADRENIAAEIARRGLGERMRILPAGPMGEVPHADVFASFRSATVFHPLIPADFAQYQRIKTTSTVIMSVGFGVPVVMDRWSEACYRHPMLVSDNRVEESLERISTASDGEFMDISAGLAAFRAREAERSGAEMARLIGQIT
ncbi:hypothetical protein AB2B41_11355 [Marimonas sp. MJW-29]|uniref:Uncharacterized protein n=1 Tax=Sulfitobacter sediminis TaxID=3234186 RepID=A0ABV3RND8_9RHOB